MSGAHTMPRSLPPDKVIALALAEDLGPGDVTSRACIPAAARGRGVLLAKSSGTLCGITIAAAVCRAVDPRVTVHARANDGERITAGRILADVRGPLRSLLAAERTALNFLQRLSGIATRTRAYVDRVAGTNAVILDTRKTTPLLRNFEKHAVRMGGGENHRQGLHDMMLIKDNHIAAAGGVANALALCKKHARRSRMKIEIETTTLAQVRAVLRAGGVDRIMLDNYPIDRIRAAVRLVHGRVPLEASGGVTLRNVRAIAQTGVEYVSVGAITHSAPALDISFEIV